MAEEGGVEHAAGREGAGAGASATAAPLGQVRGRGRGAYRTGEGERRAVVRRRASRAGKRERREREGGGLGRVGDDRGPHQGRRRQWRNRHACRARGTRGEGRLGRMGGSRAGAPGGGWAAGSWRATLGSRPRREGGFFLISIFYLAITFNPKILFITHSTTSKKIMIRYDATTEENISRVYSHKVSS
jgi:hypothetical protein